MNPVVNLSILEVEGTEEFEVSWVTRTWANDGTDESTKSYELVKKFDSYSEAYKFLREQDLNNGNRKLFEKNYSSSSPT